MPVGEEHNYPCCRPPQQAVAFRGLLMCVCLCALFAGRSHGQDLSDTAVPLFSSEAESRTTGNAAQRPMASARSFRQSDGGNSTDEIAVPLIRGRVVTIPSHASRRGPANSGLIQASHRQTGLAANPLDGVAPGLQNDGTTLPQFPLMPDENDPGLIHLPIPETKPPTVVRHGELLNTSFIDTPLRNVLGALAASEGLNIMCSTGAEVLVTGNFHSITFEDAMDSLLSVSGYTWTQRANVIIVTPMTNQTKLAPDAQGRQLRVFTLNYVSASDVQKLCTNLLSPAGAISTSEADPTNSQKTREQVLVEDLPPYVDRVAQLIRQIDIQPRQVLIEAHILQVDLKDEASHGIDFAKLSALAGTEILVATPGFNGKITDLNAFATPTYNVGIFNAGNFSGLIEALQKTTDAKTLASPKVLALNGQEAHVQIGRRLGYYVTTTTQTSSLQSVQFLDTGVVLRVTPRITDDNQILMDVKPEVSDGAVDSLGLPSSTTTEVQTNIMLPDGKGMVIGGLIKEADVTRQQKIPVLGSMKWVGKFFRRNSVTRERSEIIIALVPHIVSGPEFDACLADSEVQRATTPLLYGPLERYPRPWEPKLPDAIENPRTADKHRIAEQWKHPVSAPPQHLEYFFPAAGYHQSDAMVFDSIPMYYSETPSIPPAEQPND